MILLYDEINMLNLKFGDKIRVIWKDGDIHDGVVFGDKIGYTDGTCDSIKTIIRNQESAICTVYSI